MGAIRTLGAAAACALGISALVPALPAGERRLYAFPHRPHLNPATVAEALEASARPVPWRPGAPAPPASPSDAECRVCHDWTKGDAAEPELDACLRCHADPVSKDSYIDFKVRKSARAGTPFPHAKHVSAAGVTCFTCHAAVASADYTEFTLPPPGLGTPGRDGLPGGAAGEHLCADCHLVHGPGEGSLVQQDDRTGDGKECAACHLDAPGIVPQRFRPGAAAAADAQASRPFLHADHLAPGKETVGCDGCHAPIRKSGSVWDYDPGRGTADACAACHVAGPERKPLAADLGRKDAIPFVTFSYFSHAAHLVPAGRYPDAVKVTASCDTCHNPARDAQAPAALRAMDRSPEPLGRADLLRFEACMACHQADWAVESHGKGAWSCFKCHDAGAEGKMGPAPGRAAVDRAGAPAVRFRTVHHPGVTSKGAALRDPREAAGKECRDCHKGRLEDLPSGLAGKAFHHGPHLPPDPPDSSCLECHPGTRVASWSQDLELFEGAACSACHAGAAEGEAASDAARRTVPQFDHRGHVEPGPEGSGFRGIRCTECHDLSGKSGASVPADVASCTRCHSHDPAKAEMFRRTGPKQVADAETSRCLPCHREEGIDQARDLWGGRLPRAGDDADRRQRARLDLRDGEQWHDRGGTCASCHDLEAPGRAAAYEPRVEEAKVARIHRSSPADRWFNAKFWSEEKDAAGNSCADCHRFKPGRASLGTRGPGTRGGK